MINASSKILEPEVIANANKIQGRTDQRSTNETEFICEETAETESTADTTCRCGERIHFWYVLFSRFRRKATNLNTKQVVGNSKSLARRAVDAMGRECKHGVKFIGLSEATKYRFGRPVQVLWTKTKDSRPRSRFV